MGLVDAGAARLGWPVLHVRFEHHERAVFDSRSPAGAPVVVKVQESGEQARRERRALALAAAAGVPVPEVLRFLPGLPELLVLRRVDGEPLGSDHPPEAWAAAGRALRRIHDSPVPAGLPTAFVGREAWLAYGCEQAVAGGFVDEATATTLRARAEAVFAHMAEPDLRFVHGDASADHFLVTDRNVVAALIDFGDASVGDPAWDLTLLTRWHPDRTADVLEGYGADEAFRRRFDDVRPGYDIARLLGAAAWMQEHGFDPSSHVEALRRLA